MTLLILKFNHGTELPNITHSPIKDGQLYYFFPDMYDVCLSVITIKQDEVFKKTYPQPDAWSAQRDRKYL